MIISPTGKGIRSDSAGDGHFGASRGNRLHNGIDWLCDPGKDVVMPIDRGYMRRIIYPYAQDLSYKGLVIEGRMNQQKVFIIMFYVSPTISIGEFVTRGDVVGIAQDVSKRYPNQGMKPHVHMSLYKSIDYEHQVKGLQ